MGYNQDFIEKVRESNNLVEIISRYTELKPRGSQYTGICPFPDHKEKTPSFSVSETKQLYHCFGCKKSGNIFTFLKTYKGLSFLEALEHLAHRAGLQLPPSTALSVHGGLEQADSLASRTSLLKASRQTCAFYQYQLRKELEKKTSLLREYLKKRGLTSSLVEEFQLGYAPRSDRSLLNHWKEKKIPLEIGKKLGLLRQNSRGDIYDFFRDRLMFPILSIDSEVIGFGGRVVGQGLPKYINSAESPIFKKGRSLYGIDKTARHIRSQDQAFVVEGYMDLIALYSRGIQNVVATLGTALTGDHVRVLKNGTSNVTLVFDGDSAGQKAALKSLGHFLSRSVLPQIFVLPQGGDPDECIREMGAEGFLSKINDSEDIFLHFIKSWMGDYRGEPREKIKIIERVAPILNTLKDPRLLQIYTQELAQRMSETPESVRRWLQLSQKKRRSSHGPLLAEVSLPTVQGLEYSPPSALESSSREFKVSLERVAKDELFLLSMCLNSLDCMKFFLSHQGLECLSDPDLRAILSQSLDRYGQDLENFPRLVHSIVDQVEKPEKILHLSDNWSVEGGGLGFDFFKKCLLRVIMRGYKLKQGLIGAQIKGEKAQEKIEFLLARIVDTNKSLEDLIEKVKETPIGRSLSA